jgi:predicted aspartyl protease
MKTTLADGSSHDISVITVKTISVDGRVLHDVEAGVNESEKAPILLGLGALNRLGPYTIGDGRIVFTGEPA